MTVTLRPELERFVVEQVKAGHYPTAAAVVEAALADMARGRQADPLTTRTGPRSPRRTPSSIGARASRWPT